MTDKAVGPETVSGVLKDKFLRYARPFVKGALKYGPHVTLATLFVALANDMPPKPLNELIDIVKPSFFIAGATCSLYENRRD